MCPPGEINFFYSINGKAFVWDGKKKIDLPNEMSTDQLGQLRKLSIEVPKVNYLKGIIENQEYITDPYVTSMLCVPRPVPEDAIDIVLPWNFKNSVFAPYKPDNDAILNKCFEFDWCCSKISSFLKQ